MLRADSRLLCSLSRQPPQSYFCSAVSDTYYLVIAYHNYIVIAYHNYLVIAYHFSKTFCGAITATILSPCKEPYTPVWTLTFMVHATCCPQYVTALQQSRQLNRMVRVTLVYQIRSIFHLPEK